MYSQWYIRLVTTICRQLWTQS